MSRPADTLNAHKFRGRHVTDRKCFDHVVREEPDRHAPRRHSRPAAEDGWGGEAATTGRTGGGRRRRQRASHRRSRQQQREPEVTSRSSVRRADLADDADDDDDAGSVCSGASSACSEHSSASRGSGCRTPARRTRGSTAQTSRHVGSSRDTTSSEQSFKCAQQPDCGHIRETSVSSPAVAEGLTLSAGSCFLRARK